jgi:hypothetical protein
MTETGFLQKRLSAKEAFRRYDSKGVLYPTRHPNVLFAILKAKASANFHVKLYSTDRQNGMLSRVELTEILNELKAPEWFNRAIENQFPHLAKRVNEGINSSLR